MRIVATSILLLIYLTGFSQNSGTFKVAKKEIPKEEVRYSPNRFFIGIENTFAGKSSPKIVRNYGLRLGRKIFFKSDKRPLYFGINIGKSNPVEKYKGNTIGILAGTDMINFQLGAWSIYFPLEFNYKILFNEFNNNDLNQYQLIAGIRFPIYLLTFRKMYFHRLELSFLAKYSYDSNSVDNYKGFYPTIRIDYYF